MFTYPIMVPETPTYIPGTSAFEDAIIALSPTALYQFRDASWAAQVADTSGNDYHLVKQIATASRGIQLRTTHPGGLSVPVMQWTDWLTNGIHYLDAVGLDVPLGGAASCTYFIGIQLTAPPASSSHRIFSVGLVDTADSGTNDIAAVHYKAGVDTVVFKERHSSGLSAATDAVPTLAEPQIYSMRWDYGVTPEKLLDSGLAGSDSEKDTSTLAGAAFQDLDRPTFLGGRTNTSTAATDTAGFIIDHISVFIPGLSVAQIDTLRGLYRTEIL